MAPLERPALRRLLADIEAGKVDVIVVYKIDRLSRALMDFAKLVEVFDRHQVTFVSVTQAFNTTTSMGRLTLNVLLSFAQFEREVIGERIRDKFAASRRKGMWMGGTVPFGYVVRDRKLVIHEEQAATVRTIFERFAKIGSATTLAGVLAKEGVLTPRGKPIDKGFLYKLLTNRVYVGEAVHKGTAYPGEHQAIVTRALWDKVHAVLQESPRKRAANTRTSTPALLKGLIFGPTGCAMSPTHTRKGWPALPLLRQPGCSEAGTRCLPCRPAAGGGDRGRGHRPGARPAARAGDRGGHLASGADEEHRRPQRGAGAASTGRPRPALGRAVPRRAGAHRPAAGRAHRRRRARLRPAPASRRAGPLGAGSIKRRRRQPAAGSMTAPAQTVTVRVPFTIRKRGGRKLAIAADGSTLAPPRPRIDNTLVKALARAHRWNRLLESSRYGTAAELAAAEKINPSYVSRVLRLTLLAPDIVEAIVEGAASRSH